MFVFSSMFIPYMFLTSILYSTYTVVSELGTILPFKIQTPTRAFLLDNQGKTQSFLAPKFFLFLGRYLGFLRL